MERGGEVKTVFYRLWQCTWGFLQTFMGLIIFLINFRARHFCFHGAVFTECKLSSSISLGMFVFISSEVWIENDSKKDGLPKRILVHEYGHTVQSLILGPLYLFVIGIPSLVWGFFGAKMRNKKQIPYGAFFTEGWANVLGEKVTKEESIEMMKI